MQKPVAIQPLTIEGIELSLWGSFILKTAGKVIRKTLSLRGAGTEVVEHREKGYREIDPDIIGLDRMIEDIILGELEDTQCRFIIHSEEAGRLEIGNTEDTEIEPLYFFCDPIDGSGLYQRQIQAFWYSAFAIWENPRKPIASVVANLITGQVTFSDGNNAYTCICQNGKFSQLQKLHSRSGSPVSLKDAYLETYLMKPPILFHSLELFEPVFKKAKFILPNGGPSGFSDLARGSIDLYLAWNESATEVFTGLPIALAAGMKVKTLDGTPVEFKDDKKAEYTLAAAASVELLDEIFTLLKR
jgi:fructose-1,6-bisphosphatase/inositol monophosphatase family enzyme